MRYAVHKMSERNPNGLREDRLRTRARAIRIQIQIHDQIQIFKVPVCHRVMTVAECW